MEINDEILKLLHPFSLIVSGVSQSGKSELVKKLLENCSEIIKPAPSNIIVCYSEDQQAYKDMKQINPDIQFREGLDFDLEEFNSNVPTILIIDDQMSDAVQNKKIQTFFTKGVHHRSVSVILLTQNLFPQGKHGRDIRLNCHYLIIMKSPTFASQVQCLGRQIFPNSKSYFSDAYKKATERPYSYLFVNLHPRSNDSTRVLQGIFPEENKYVYLPK
jgi:hypothetical protein